MILLIYTLLRCYYTYAITLSTITTHTMPYHIDYCRHFFSSSLPGRYAIFCLLPMILPSYLAALIDFLFAAGAPHKHTYAAMLILMPFRHCCRHSYDIDTPFSFISSASSAVTPFHFSLTIYATLRHVILIYAATTILYYAIEPLRHTRRRHTLRYIHMPLLR